MSKDTNSFGHDKTLTYESRGFVYKKRKNICSKHQFGRYNFITLQHHENVTRSRHKARIMCKFATFRILTLKDMTIRKFTLVILSMLLCISVQAQNGAYERYIQQYSGMAIDQMKRYGIPASITLAQGLLESAAGQSRLAKEANNHFGIKVSGYWTGPYIVKSDDRPDDKFRVYSSPAESYEDHSKFLRSGKRYASLFDLKKTDYKGWAHGLKRAGYATSPTYAQALINMIDKYDLHAFDKARHHESREERHERKEKEKLQQRTNGHTIRRCNGQYYVIALEGDTYDSLAKTFKEKESKLRKYNDVDATFQLKSGDIVYLGKKQKKADAGLTQRTHTLRVGESLYSISQRYGIRLSSLCKMNPIKRNYHFKIGDEIRIK